MTHESGIQKTTHITVKGKFNFHATQHGLYKIECFHQAFYFEPVIVNILTEEQAALIGSKNQITAYLYDIKTGGKGQRLRYPLELEPSHRLKYFDIEEPFNPLVYLKSPYFLMIGFSIVMMFMMK